MKTRAENKKSEFQKALDSQHRFFLETAEVVLKNRFFLPPSYLKKLSKNKTNFHFVGTGSSYHCAQWAKDLFLSYGFHAQASHTFDIFSGNASYEKKDNVFLISHRGLQNLTLAASEVLKNKTTLPPVLICAEGSPTGDLPYVYGGVQETAKAHSQSLIGAMSSISFLLWSVLSDMPDQFSKKSAQDLLLQRKLLGRLLLEKNFPPSLSSLKKFRTLRILGLGPFWSMAQETALKIQEVAHLPAFAHHLEEFLHGPVAAVENTDGILVFSAENQRFTNLRPLFKTLGVSFVWPELPAKLMPAFQALFALRMGQELALRLALQQNIDPDLNREDEPLYKKAFHLCAWP